MKKIILEQPRQITHSMEVNQNVKVTGDFDSIVLAGLGGSGHPGDLLNALGITRVPLYVHRNYGLPLEYLNQINLTKPLIITSSYSGNTEEALSAYEVAQENSLPTLVSTAGGKLAELAKKDGFPVSKIDFPGMQPRHTLFAAFAGLAQTLINSNLADDITTELTATAAWLDNITPELESSAKQIAARINGKIPVYNSTDNLGFAAKNMKIQTNENAKYPAFWNTFPELNHNELIGFSKLAATNNPNQFFVLILRDPSDHPRNAARIDVTTTLYKEWGVDVEHLTVQGENSLQKIFYAVTFGLWLTYHLALANNLDPVPVEGVEGFKAMLKAKAANQDS